MKRTKKSAILSICLIVALLITGAFAYLSDHDNAINKFSFTDEDGNQAIDIQLTETEWKEQDGQNIKYGTPVAKNPVANNISTAENAHDMYAFATVILPAKAVAVQNTQGAIVDVNDAEPQNGVADFGFKYVIANNISANDIDEADKDETEIVGVDNGVEFGQELVEENGAIACPAIIGTAGQIQTEGADTPDDETDDEFEDGYIEAACDGEIDPVTGVCDTCGHQYMFKLVKDENSNVEIPIRELYATEILDNDDTDGSIANRGVNKAGAWTEYNAASDANNTPSVYARSAYNRYVAAVAADPDNGVAGSDAVEGWIEITEAISDPTVYFEPYDMDGDGSIAAGEGRYYSAHVYYYSKPIAKGESTLPVFDYVEVINTPADQIQEEDNMDIYVEVYGIQTDGIATDVVTGDDAATVENGVAIWDALTNSENQDAFDIFGVVKGYDTAND